MIEERYDLAIGRIGRIGGEESVKLPFRKFFQKTASFLLMIDELKKEIEAGAAADRGFYWVGAYACDKYIAVGSDDGANDYGDPADSACFYTIDPKTGEIIDKIGGIRGDIRTSTVYDDGYLYFCTKGGVIYKV